MISLTADGCPHMEAGKAVRAGLFFLVLVVVQRLFNAHVVELFRIEDLTTLHALNKLIFFGARNHADRRVLASLCHALLNSPENAAYRGKRRR